MIPKVEKVTAFVTRTVEGQRQLLLIQHPHAGIQLPAGTVEPDETPEVAALREAQEETGLNELVLRQYLGCAEDPLPEGHRIVAQTTPVYMRPDLNTQQWTSLRRGISVALNRTLDDFCQVTYQEYDQLPDPNYVTMCLIGWVPCHVLAAQRPRYHYHLEFHGQSAERWIVPIDQHVFTLFWAPVASLPPLIEPQNRWLEFFSVA